MGRPDDDDVDRAVAEGRAGGFSLLALDGRDRVVGATVVGPHAGEVLAEALLAAEQGASAAGDLAGVMHPYPTWSYGLWDAALGHYRAGLAKPTARRVTRTMLAARRRWLDLRSRPRGRAAAP